MDNYVRGMAHRLGIKSEKCVGFIEYGLLAAVMAVAVTFAISAISTYINTAFISIGTAITSEIRR